MADKISQSDYAYVPVDADANFSAEHNRKVIQETIDEANRLRAKKMRNHVTEVKGRTSAIAQYFNDLAQGRTESNINKYFGKNELNKLRGVEVGNKTNENKIGEELRKRVINKSKHPDFVVN